MSDREDATELHPLASAANEAVGAAEAAERAKQPAGSASAPAKRPPNRIVATWLGAHRFESGRPDRPRAIIDADGVEGQGPVDALLSALATCASTDVIDILTKRRTPPTSLEVEVVGTRVDTIPRRLKHVLLRFRIAGDGIEREHAERAVDLAVTKYCSVGDSLDPAIPVEWEIELR